MKKTRILVTGASGLVGKSFIRHVLRQGFEVFAVVRNPKTFSLLPQKNVFKWSHENPLPKTALVDIDAIVHLAGENIADGRWTENKKKRIVESRLLGTKNLISALNSIPTNQRPKVLISGSAIGYYGYDCKEPVYENSKVGKDYLAKLCHEWEDEALAAEKLGLRVVLLRTGIVLSKEGGALSKMPPVQISNGQAWMSWVHIEDMVRIIQFAVEHDSVKGPINCVSLNPVKNKEFIKLLGDAYGLPFVGYVPKIILKAVLGEAANLVTSSLNVQPQALIKSGFNFNYPDLKSALNKELENRHLFDIQFSSDQYLPLKPEQVFPFFSQAENLESLTPPWLNFHIVSKSTPKIEKGSLINYQLKIHGIPVSWQTLIKDWNPNLYFVDEQLKGPYSKWYHVHSFEEVTGGCLLRDEVTYRVPLSILGKLFLNHWIAKDVNQIFDYRKKQIQKKFIKGEDL